MRDRFGGESGVREVEGCRFLEFGSPNGDLGGGARLQTVREDGF